MRSCENMYIIRFHSELFLKLAHRTFIRGWRTNVFEFMQRASAIVSEKLRKYLVEKCHHYRGIIENVRPLPVIVGRVFLHNICQFRL